MGGSIEGFYVVEPDEMGGRASKATKKNTAIRSRLLLVNADETGGRAKLSTTDSQTTRIDRVARRDNHPDSRTLSANSRRTALAWRADLHAISVNRAREIAPQLTTHPGSRRETKKAALRKKTL